MRNALSLGSSSSTRLRLLATFWSVRISSDNKWWTSRFYWMGSFPSQINLSKGKNNITLRRQPSLSARPHILCPSPVDRVSKLRDDLLALRADCSSLYSKGRTLTTEQTKMMISGITQSLNSAFPQNTSLTPVLTPALTPAGLGTPGSAFTSSLTSCLTPSMSPSVNSVLQPPSVQTFMDSSGGVDPSSLRHLKHMQISKPLRKSSLADPSLTDEEVNMRFIKGLQNWVQEMQVSCCSSMMCISFKLTVCTRSILKCILFSNFEVAAWPLGVGQRFAKRGDAHG